MNDESTAITLSCEPVGPRGQVKLTVLFPSGETHTDKLDICSADARSQFAARLCAERPGVGQEELLSELERLASETATSAAKDSDRSRSQTDRIVDLFVSNPDVELFHSPEGEPFASVPVKGHRETWKIVSNGLKDWISHEFYRVYHKSPTAQGMQDALSTLAGRAKYEGAKRPVALRVADHNGELWLDLCDEDWRVVRVAAEGWSIVESIQSPVRFVRRKGMMPLPLPVKGGALEELRPLVNLADDDQWVLAASWLLGAIRPRGPYPVLLVSGEQGSAKSCCCRFLRGIVDPHAVPIRRPPKDEREVFIGASNSHVIAFDNLSGIRPEMSDALCSLATGGGYGTRKLFEDDEETLFHGARPVILNAIDDFHRPDLLDRGVLLQLPRISDQDRREERELEAEYERVRPRVLGALLDATSAALRNVSRIRMTRKPRMADFAKWIVAAESGLGWKSGRFMESYERNRSGADLAAIESSTVGLIIVDLVADGPFVGTATELLHAINNRQPRPTPLPPDWPSASRAMGAQLRRLAPALRSCGVRVELPHRSTGRAKRKVLRIEMTAEGYRLWNQHPRVRTVDRQAAAGVTHADHADHADRADHRPPPSSAPRGYSHREAQRGAVPRRKTPTGPPDRPD